VDEGVTEAPTKLPQIRCAVYTRKSTEEGLEQAFNSLMAQREAAEAYIASQGGQGWRMIADRYDDGGFSGASMERPALRKLLADIEAGGIDCVVVYKVDRLSRSLLDFARIVSILDARGVSFVSVTQQFNTSTPIGRLTLNILLSFAQFERELIGERTRDKMAAARRKGLWTGGTPPLGYDLDPQGGRLIVNEVEAEQVRQIFRLFLETRTLADTTKEMNRRGWTTKAWTTRKGVFRRGVPFRWPTLRLLLTNILYIGGVRHKHEIVPGQQDAIIGKALFEEVNAVLSRRDFGGTTAVYKPALLSGLLYCEACGSAMVPTYIKRKRSAVRSYGCVPQAAEAGLGCASPPVSATLIETKVLERVRSLDGTGQTSELATPRRSLENAIERIVYSGATGRLSLRLRQPVSRPMPKLLNQDLY
jgi:site-specific DNA recombinase